MESYIKRDNLGNNIYEKTTGSYMLGWDKEVWREYDENNRLVKTTVLSPDGVKNIYLNKYKESIDEKGGICKKMYHYRNGVLSHQTKECIDYNKVKRYYGSYMYDEKQDKWYIDKIEGYDERGNKVYNKVTDATQGAIIEEKWEYNQKGKCIFYADILKQEWERKEYDEKGNVIKLTKNDGFEEITKYDESNIMIYQKNTKGYIYELKNIEIDGIKYKREQYGYPDKENPQITTIDSPIIENDKIDFSNKYAFEKFEEHLKCKFGNIN